MEVAQRQGDLSCVELSLAFGKSLLLREVLEKLTTLNKVHNEIDPVGFLEDVIHTYDERVVDLEQDDALDFQAVEGLMSDNDVFPDALHSVELVVSPHPDKINFTEGTSSNDASELKVFERGVDHSVSSVK